MESPICKAKEDTIKRGFIFKECECINKDTDI